MAVHPFPWPASLAPPSSPTNSPQPPSLNQTLLPTHGSQLFPPRLLNHCPVQTTTTHLGFHWFLYFHPTHVTSETILHAAYQPPVALQIETNILTCLRGLHGLTPTYLSSPTHSFPLLSVPNPTAHFLIFRVTKFLLPQGLCTCCSLGLECSSLCSSYLTCTQDAESKSLAEGIVLIALPQAFARIVILHLLM